jgi:serine/threonine protein kinase
MDLGDRIELARSFAETAALFEDLEFLHSDINPPNLFVDLDNLRVAVIDVDGGALVGVGDGVPEACGKSDDFLAPELADPTSGATVTAFSERWSYGITVSYLLLGTHPIFFLRSLGGRVIEEYQDSFTWPDVDLASDLVNEGIAADYPVWKADVEQLSGEVAEHFRTLLAGHADPSLRPSAWGWALALQPGPPWFEEISASGAVMVGGKVPVSWWAPRASSVTVAGITGLPARGSLLVAVAASGPIRLEAANAYGTTESWTDPVAVFRALPPPPLLRVPRLRPPALPRLRLPTPPLPAGPHRARW